MWPEKGRFSRTHWKITNTLSCLIFSIICVSWQTFMVCSVRGRRRLANHVGYQHTECLRRQARRVPERKSSFWQKCAFGIPTWGQLWSSPWTCFVGFVHSSAALLLDLVIVSGDPSAQPCFSVLSRTVGSGTQNDIGKESLMWAMLLTFQLLCYHNHQSLIHSSGARIVL